MDYQERWPLPDAKADLYRKVLDSFSKNMRQRINANPPRTWAQFWRVWSDEQVLSRQAVRALVPPISNHNRRDGEWFPPEYREAFRQEQEIARRQMRRERGAEKRVLDELRAICAGDA